MCSKNVVIRKPVRVLNVPTENVVEALNINHNRILKKAAKETDVPAIIKKPAETVVSYEKLPKYDSRFMYVFSLLLIMLNFYNYTRIIST